MSTFSALVINEGGGPAEFKDLTDADLPEGDVTVGVRYSSLNYKDGLAVSGKGKIARSLPMTCGIDLAGVVEASDNSAYSVGDEVLVTGWGLSESHPGGFTQRQRVPAKFLTAKPDALSSRPWRSAPLGSPRCSVSLPLRAQVSRRATATSS